MDNWKTNHTKLIQWGFGQAPMGFLAINKTSQIHSKQKHPKITIT